MDDSSAVDAVAGESIRVRADVVTGVGLSLTECESTARGGGHSQSVRASIRLSGPGSATIDEVQAGFL